MFGSFLTSLPFLNGGGVIAETAEAKNALVAEAITPAKRLRAEYLELRHRMDPQLGLPTKTHKVAMVLPIEPDSEKMWAALPHKVRTDIRKGIKSGLTAEFGGEERLDDFYEVFARNMRDLGTPVYSRRFFSTMLKAFPSDDFICVIRHQGKAVAASFLMGYRDGIEAGWSSSRYDYLAMRPNMFLYWKVLCFAAERRYRQFDFGRSSVDSGTHRFKKQWGFLQRLFRRLLPSPRVVLGVVCGTHEMKRDVRPIADYPAIVAGRDVEEVSRLHLEDSPVLHRCDRFP